MDKLEISLVGLQLLCPPPSFTGTNSLLCSRYLLSTSDGHWASYRGLGAELSHTPPSPQGAQALKEMTDHHISERGVVIRSCAGRWVSMGSTLMPALGPVPVLVLEVHIVMFGGLDLLNDNIISF